MTVSLSKTPRWIRWGIYAVVLILLLLFAYHVLFLWVIACVDGGLCAAIPFVAILLVGLTYTVKLFILPIFWLQERFGGETYAIEAIGVYLCFIFALGAVAERVWERWKRKSL